MRVLGGSTGVSMTRHWLALVLLASSGAVSAGAAAQDKKSVPWGAVVRSETPQPAASEKPLTPRQLELVRQVNAYFNKLTLLRGSFVQTASNGKRQRGVFHLMRPGRFRFEYAPPSRTVVLSDGKYVAVQDYDLNTDDRSDLGQTPFRALLQTDVDLLRDAHCSVVEETGDTISLVFADKRAEANGKVTLFLATKPALQVKAWITKDNQGLDTRIELADLETVDSIDQRLFDPTSRIERRKW